MWAVKAQVSSDGRTVWVNSCTGALARFSKWGVDVHTEDTTGCLHCTPGPTAAVDWELFKAKVLEHHGVTVDDMHKPAYLAHS